MGNSNKTAQGTFEYCEAFTLTLRELQLCSSLQHTDMADVGPQTEGDQKDGVENIAICGALDTLLVYWKDVEALLSVVRSRTVEGDEPAKLPSLRDEGEQA